MKKVVFIITAAVFTSTFISCKNTSETENLNSQTEIVETNVSEDLALADTSEINAENNEQFLYVTAISGLSLREYNNLKSNKLARMPYGTKVKVLNAEGKNTMTIGGINGAMYEVEFNHKKGFAFNGYLSKYFPPERDISAKGYVKELNKTLPEVIFTENTGGTASNPTATEAVTIPDGQWHEAFFMAQRLFDFPKEFDFPNPKGKDTQVIADKKPKKDVWISQLEISRKDNSLEKIEYVYKSQKLNSNVTIIKEGNAIKISKTEEVK